MTSLPLTTAESMSRKRSKRKQTHDFKLKFKNQEINGYMRYFWQ